MFKQPHQGQPVFAAGKPLAEATAVMILIHGRGATAQSILELASLLQHQDYAYLALQAAYNTWYPTSFLAPMAQNEPGLSSGLQAVAEIMAIVEAAGISAENIVLAGFSQGACIASECVARRAKRYGGLIVFSGGVIGPPGTPRNYPGSLEDTPIFIGCSDNDFHIPLERVQETTAVFKKLGGIVTEKIYPDMGHTIIQDEIDQAQKIVNQVIE